MMGSIQQFAAWVLGKITAIVQVTDTDVSFRMKAKSRSAHETLRRELMKLAGAEDCMAIFRCGSYEVLRTLVESIEALRDEMIVGEDLLAAMRRNGWLAWRPNLSSKKTVGVFLI